jgi:hypothetical protein
VDPAERALLLRQRFKALGGVIPPRSSPSKPKPKPRVYKNRFSFGTLEKVRECGWLKERDEKELDHVRISRKARISPLTRISEQLPRKLKRG